MKPRENHLGLKKKGYRLNFQEVKNPLTCRVNLPQDLKTQKMPLFHIGRLQGNEAKRNYLELDKEGLQVPLLCAGESLFAVV